MHAWGRNRAARRARGKWYFGKRVGIPARRTARIVPARTISQLATTTTTTRAANIGQTMSRMQANASRVERGSESMGEIKAQTGWINDGFGTVYNYPINPAEPSCFPCLSAIANQYQRFNTRALAFTFTPSTSTAVNGQVYMAFVPRADAPEPASIEDYEGLLGTEKGGIYGAATRLIVDAQQLQQAYRVQTVEKVTDIDNDSSPLNSSGRFFMSVAGIDSSLDNKTIGTLTVSYCYEFTTRQLTQGSNALHGTYAYVGDGDDLTLTSDLLVRGHHIMRWDEALNCYRIRSPRSRLFYAFQVKDATDTAPVLEWSLDATNWETATYEAHAIGSHTDVAFGAVGNYRFFRLTTAATAIELVLHFATRD